MDRKEAVQVLKEIYEACETIDESWVALMPPDADGVIAEGYQLHIKTKINELDKNCIESILRKYGLELREVSDTAIIYRPIRSS